MNDSLDMLVASVTRCQEDAIRDISDEFLKQMNNSFHLQFRDFNLALDQLKKAQKENTAYTSAMYQTMSQKLSETYEKQDKAITDMVKEMGGMQTRYMSTANRHPFRESGDPEDAAAGLPACCGLPEGCREIRSQVLGCM